MQAIESCRTSALGGHREKCGHCAEERISYNSCCNRHCPKCQNLARTKWVESRKGELLPIDYHHVVFTIPEQLNDLVLRNKPLLYKILFAASASTLQTIAADPRHLGARIGFFSVLLTTGADAPVNLSGDKACGTSAFAVNGGKICCFIRISTALRPEEASALTEPAGFPRSPASFCRSRYSPACSGGSSSKRSKPLSGKIFSASPERSSPCGNPPLSST